jgi:hypothetical protein
MLPTRGLFALGVVFNLSMLPQQKILERDNLRRALKQVRRNKGAPGTDGMSVDELPKHLAQTTGAAHSHHGQSAQYCPWAAARIQLLSKSSVPASSWRTSSTDGCHGEAWAASTAWAGTHRQGHSRLEDNWAS